MQNAENKEITITAAPAVNGSVNWKKRIRVNDIHEYWMNTIGVETLDEDKTIRLTAVLPYEKNGKIIDNQRTLTEQVRSADELIKLMEEKYRGIRDNDWKKLVGWSMSSAIYNYIPADKDGRAVAPTMNQIVGMNAMVIDMDSHTSQASNGRFHFNSYSKKSRRIIAAYSLNVMNQLFVKADFDFKIHVSNAYATGGGLQFIIKFNRTIYKEEAVKVFTYIKHSLKVQNKKDPKKQERYNITGADELDNIVQSWIDFDLSSGDISHTQRIGGTVNPKEAYIGSFSEEIKDFYNEDLMDEAREYIHDVFASSPFDDDTISKFKAKFNNHVLLFKTYDAEIKAKTDEVNERLIRDASDDNRTLSDEDLFSYKELRVNSILLDATIRAKTTSTYKEASDKMLGTPMDYDILKKITSADQAAMMALTLGEPQESNSRYDAYTCPFHDETSASFAIYKNADGIISYARDFHDGETYNLITFLMEKNQYSRSDAVREIVIHFKLELKTTDRKAMHKEENEGTVSALINKVNVEDFVYYRLANKNRNCIIREFEMGESYMFDGTRMLSDHVLSHQLGLKGADMELRAIFHDMFVEKILINAFEEFSPGKPYTYERKFIKYINLWIPGKEYLKIHELAESVDQMDIASALGLIRDRLPNSWFFLNQITQKGSIEYFLNWLICVGNFEVMSTIPILTSTQGTGKGVFITQFLEYYLNHEYVNTVTSDKLGSNFNSYMERSSLLVLDEGDFSRAHSVDVLKLLSGNGYIQLEKKGVDSSKVRRHFNMIMMTNGESPMTHPANDRRMSYFRLDVTLADSVKHLGFEFIDDFIDALKDEMQEFWTILVKTTPKREWINMNLKDNQFNKQILLMHPFGRLVIKILEDDWADIQLQLNENTDDAMVITANLEMVKTIRASFEAEGTIDLTIINKYLKSLNFKSYTSVQQFITNNQLGKNGISTLTTDTAVKIVINKHKLKNLINMDNNLGNIFDCYARDNLESTLALVNAHAEEEKEAEVYAQRNPQVEIFEGLAPMDTSDPLGIKTPPKPQAPNTIVQ